MGKKAASKPASPIRITRSRSTKTISPEAKKTAPKSKSVKKTKEDIKVSNEEVDVVVEETEEVQALATPSPKKRKLTESKPDDVLPEPDIKRFVKTLTGTLMLNQDMTIFGRAVNNATSAPGVVAVMTQTTCTPVPNLSVPILDEPDFNQNKKGFYAYKLTGQPRPATTGSKSPDYRMFPGHFVNHDGSSYIPAAVGSNTVSLIAFNACPDLKALDDGDTIILALPKIDSSEHKGQIHYQIKFGRDAAGFNRYYWIKKKDVTMIGGIAVQPFFDD